VQESNNRTHTIKSLALHPQEKEMLDMTTVRKKT